MSSVAKERLTPSDLDFEIVKILPKARILIETFSDANNADSFTSTSFMKSSITAGMMICMTPIYQWKAKKI